MLRQIQRQPGANIIDTVDRVGRCCRSCRLHPGGGPDSVAVDRSTTIRASLRDVEISLMIAVILVVLVVFVFLRDGAPP